VGFENTYKFKIKEVVRRRLTPKMYEEKPT
jgi:hypothetical protein